MKLSSQQLPSGKWGIYSDTGLLATVESQVICETIMANLVSGRRDAPCDDVNALYQVPELRKKTEQSAEAVSERKGHDAAAMKTSQTSAQGSISQKAAAQKTAAQKAAAQKAAAQKTAKTTQAQTAAEPSIGQAKARASAKRKRRSSNRTDTSLAS